MDEAVTVIPARWASARFPGKPLALLRGAGGVPRTLLDRSVAAARAAAEATPGVTGIHVATDDDRIAEEAARLGAGVILTDPACANGTERVAQAVARAGLTQPIVVNLQGDAPLTPPAFVAALIAAMRADPATPVATPVLRCEPEALANLLADRRAGRVGATTAVCDRQGRAMYFSKEVIPYTGPSGQAPGGVLHHVGVYAYRAAALAAYVGLEPGALERAEGLEQLRFLEHGLPVATVRVEAPPGAVFWEVNNPGDVALVEGYFARMGIG